MNRKKSSACITAVNCCSGRHLSGHWTVSIHQAPVQVTQSTLQSQRVPGTARDYGRLAWWWKVAPSLTRGSDTLYRCIHKWIGAAPSIYQHGPLTDSGRVIQLYQTRLADNINAGSVHRPSGMQYSPTARLMWPSAPSPPSILMT